MIAILGFGISGKIINEYLINKGYNVIIIDDNYEKDNKYNVLKTEAALELDYVYDYIVKSPGIKYDHPFLKYYANTKIINDIELFYNESIKYDVKIIGITGTNGKTSTVTLLNNVLNRAGFTSVAAGNIGVSPLSLIDKLNELDYVVLELSSFQLQQIDKFKTYASFFLNFTPDHLDYHSNLSEYFDAKMQIIKNGSISNKFYIGNNIDINVKNASIKYGIKLDIDYTMIDMGINPENIELINAFLIDEDISNNVLIEELEQGYKGIEHRVEFVSEINNVKFYNDSKATNVSASAFALSRLNNIILLVGGYDKNEDLTKLMPHLQNVVQVIAYGDNRNKFNFIDDIIIVDDLKQALEQAINCSSSGDTILLSPCSASYDQFDNFEKRGKYFKSLVEEYNNEVHN